MTKSPSRGQRVLRVGIGLLLVATCIKVWSLPGDTGGRAYGQIPNAGAQRANLLSEVRRTNQLLSEVLVILRSKSIKVDVKGLAPENTKAVSPVRRIKEK